MSENKIYIGLILGIICLLFFGQPVDDAWGKKYLTDKGYKNIELKMSWSCDLLDTKRMDFTAIDSKGNKASGKLCYSPIMGENFKAD